MQLITFLGFTTFVAIIAYLSSKKTDETSSDGYFLGGRSLTAGVIAGSLLLTNLSTEQIVGLNGQAFTEGILVMAWESLAAIAMVVTAVFLLPRYLKGGLTTVPQFLGRRYDTFTKTLASGLFLSGYVIVLLPIVLYSGAVAFSAMFNLPEVLGITRVQSIWACVWGIGIIGSIYAVFGGLKAVAVSDTINAVGLLIGGIMIPIFGLSYVGDGSITAGFSEIMASNPEKFNSIGDSAASFHIFGDTLASADEAYPKLVSQVLPASLVGFFAAVLFGAILSSFNSALNSSVTLFGIDIYKEHFNKEASEKQVVKAGKIFGVLLAILAMFIAPLIMYADDGLFGYLQKVNGCYSIPILTIIIVGYLTKKVPAIAAKVAIILGAVLYSISIFFLEPHYRNTAVAAAEAAGITGDELKYVETGAYPHFLHVMAILFLMNVIIMLVIGQIKPRKEAYEAKYTRQVDITPWKYVNQVGVLVCIIVVAIYVMFSPLMLGS